MGGVCGWVVGLGGVGWGWEGVGVCVCRGWGGGGGGRERGGGQGQMGMRGRDYMAQKKGRGLRRPPSEFRSEARTV